MTTSVLIVDDELFIVELYRDILQLRGYKVMATAFDGEEAVRRYSSSEEKPDVIIMDHRMPVMNGVEATREQPDSEDHIRERGRPRREGGTGGGGRRVPPQAVPDGRPHREDGAGFQALKGAWGPTCRRPTKCDKLNYQANILERRL
jgi:CheY-like chemotaxis protein